MHIVVSIKQVPDTAEVRIDPRTNTMIRNGIASRLGWPQLTSVLSVDEVNLEERWIKVQRMVEGGREIVRAKLPCVITCTREMNVPRYATFPNMVKAARYDPLVWDREALGIDDESQVGLRGSPTIVSKVWAPAPRQRG